MMRSVAHDAPEPAQALIAVMLAAACDLAKLPSWFKQHRLQMTSPAARQVLWALGRRLSQNPDLGFAFAERVPEDAIGSLWQVYEAAPTLRALNLAYNEWSSLLLEFMEVQVVDDGALTWFRMVARDGTALDRAEEDYRAAMMVKSYRRLLADPGFCPAAIHFTYAAPRNSRAHKSALGTDHLRFAQPCLQVALSRIDADARLGSLAHRPARFDEGAHDQRFERLSQAARVLAAQPRESSFSARVETLITERLRHGIDEASIARDLGLSVRSLRRRLAAGGATFRALLDRSRRREGDLFLEDEELPIARVARLLGFASDGALRNSMRRWSQSPSERRRAIAQASTLP